MTLGKPHLLPGVQSTPPDEVYNYTIENQLKEPRESPKYRYNVWNKTSKTLSLIIAQRLYGSHLSSQS